AVACGLAAALAQLASLLVSHGVTEVSDVGILVPAPGRSTECRGRPSRCHELVLNELGFRGSLAGHSTLDSQLVAFIGDSYVFGSGVGDGDTVPANVARMLADLEPPVAVVNAGIPGLNAGSFPGVIRYVRSRLNPDVIVVLLKDDDLDETDKFTRWNRFRHSFWFRLLSVTNFEPIYETARQAVRQWFGRRDERQLLRRQLDSVAAASAGAKLLLIAALTDDLRPVFDAWMDEHPDVSQVSSWKDDRYWQAEKIPHDGHWTEAGCQTIAAMVAPVLRLQVSVVVPAGTGSGARHSPVAPSATP